MILDLTTPSHLTRESEKKKHKMYILKTCSIMLFIMFFKLTGGWFFLVHLKFMRLLCIKQ